MFYVELKYWAKSKLQVEVEHWLEQAYFHGDYNESAIYGVHQPLNLPPFIFIFFFIWICGRGEKDKVSHFIFNFRKNWLIFRVKTYIRICAQAYSCRNNWSKWMANETQATDMVDNPSLNNRPKSIMIDRGQSIEKYH